jgi:hypothetical protein
MYSAATPTLGAFREGLMTEQYLTELDIEQLEAVAGGFIKNGGRGGEDYWDGSEEYGKL